jgi:hypothetical protein
MIGGAAMAIRTARPAIGLAPPHAAVLPRPRIRRSHVLLVLLLFAWPVMGLAVLLVRAVRAAAMSAARAAVLGALVVSVATGTVVAGPDTAATALRAVLLAPFTVPAVAWGFANGGVLHVHGDMLVMTGMDWGYGPRSGVTIGQVFLTSDDSKLHLLAHEERHSTQWLVFGGLLPPLYLVAELVPGGPDHNIFEIAAGLQSGGYEA